MVRKPDEFQAFPSVLHPGFGPFSAVARWDARYDDGDTVWFMVDPGFNRYDFTSIRFAGIDAPEIRGTNASDAGPPARDYLFGILPYNAPCRLYTDKDPDKYGRYIGTVFTFGERGQVICVNTEMVNAGHAAIREDWGWANVLRFCREMGVAIP